MIKKRTTALLRPAIMTIDGKKYNNHCANVEHSFKILPDAAWRFELRNGDQGWSGDPSTGAWPRSRAELGAYQPDGTLPKEKPVWVSFELNVLPGALNTAMHVYLGQMHNSPDLGESGTSPALSARLDKEFLEIVTYTSTQNPLVTPPPGVVQFRQPLVRGVSIHITWRFIYSQTIGEVQVWLDHVLKVDVKGPHGYVDAQGPYARFGIYRVGNGVMPPETIAAIFNKVQWGTSALAT